MRVQVRYFASLREALGAVEGVDLAPLGAQAPATVGALRLWLAERSPAHRERLGPSMAVRAACDQSLCGPDHPLHDGAEVAFFPPVTGG